MPSSLSTILSRLSTAFRLWLPSRGNVLFTLLVALSLILYGNSVGVFAGANPSAPNPSAPAPANIPEATSTGTIAYQGRLFNTAGAPLNSTYPMTFTLYSTASGGPVLWREARPGVSVSDGLFNVLLGSTTPITQTIITGNNTLWLGVQVGGDPEMTPRVQLGSAPYAMQGWTVPDGSVTTEKIADGAVTGPKISRRLTSIYLTAPVTMTTANQTYTIFSTTITPSLPSLVTIHTSVGFHNSSSFVAVMFLLVDGVVVGSADNSITAGIGEQNFLSLVVPLTPGSHTISIQAWATANNSSAVPGPRSYLMIVEE